MTDETASDQMDARTVGNLSQQITPEQQTCLDADCARREDRRDRAYAHHVRTTALNAALQGPSAGFNTKTVLERAKAFEEYILGMPPLQEIPAANPPHDTAAWSGAQIAQWRNGG